MKPFLVLITSFLISLAVLKLRQGSWYFDLAGRIAMAAMLLFTALGHFTFSPSMYLTMPDFVSSHWEILYLSGLLQMVLATGLLIPRFQRIAAGLLILFFLLILPTGIKAALENINYLAVGEHEEDNFNLWLGVPFKVGLMLWVYFSTLKK